MQDHLVLRYHFSRLAIIMKTSFSKLLSALLIVAGLPVEAATLAFDSTCDPLPPAVGTLPPGFTLPAKPAITPWTLTFEQRDGSGACVLATIFKDSSLATTVASNEPIATLRPNGYALDFLPVDGVLPLLASTLSEAGFIQTNGNDSISIDLDDAGVGFNLLSFRFFVGSGADLNLDVTLRSGAVQNVNFGNSPPTINQSPTLFFAKGDPASPSLDYISRMDFTSSSSLLWLDALTLSTTVAADTGGGGGTPLPEPSSLALLALAGGLAAARRRQDD